MTNQEMFDKYGFPFDLTGTKVNERKLFEAKNMLVWECNFPNMPPKIYINRDLQKPLHTALDNLRKKKIQNQLLTFNGCYNPRPIRGYENKFAAAISKNDIKTAIKYVSKHSWGTAIDLNAAWNGLGKEPTLSPEFVKCFTDAGFTWGGTFKRLDGMHFEL